MSIFSGPQSLPEDRMIISSSPIDSFEDPLYIGQPNHPLLADEPPMTPLLQPRLFTGSFHDPHTHTSGLRPTDLYSYATSSDSIHFFSAAEVHEQQLHEQPDLVNVTPRPKKRARGRRSKGKMKAVGPSGSPGLSRSPLMRARNVRTPRRAAKTPSRISPHTPAALSGGRILFNSTHPVNDVFSDPNGPQMLDGRPPLRPPLASRTPLVNNWNKYVPSSWSSTWS
ncbi:hypothetical protein FRB99_004259 [Tulasnella sp. 403]|nr:hypothetical protein FRB99_004259 [Tulasnella sp. 403]